MWLVVALNPPSGSNFYRSDRPDTKAPVRHTPLPRQTHDAARAMLRVIASLTGRRALASSSRIPARGVQLRRYPVADRPIRRVRARGRGSRPARPLEEEPTRDRPATEGDTSLASRARARGDCEKVVAVADCGHGVGRALVSALLEFPECRMVVAGATPSSELTTSLHMQHWAECDAMQLDVSRVNLADDAEVKAWKDRVEFTFGVPDVLITNCGELPSYWKLNYEAAEAFCPNDNEVVVGGCRPLEDSTLHADANAWDDDTGDAPPTTTTIVRPARVWETRAIDWSRTGTTSRESPPRPSLHPGHGRQGVRHRRQRHARPGPPGRRRGGGVPSLESGDIGADPLPVVRNRERPGGVRDVAAHDRRRARPWDAFGDCDTRTPRRTSGRCTARTGTRRRRTGRTRRCRS